MQSSVNSYYQSNRPAEIPKNILATINSKEATQQDKLLAYLYAVCACLEDKYSSQSSELAPSSVSLTLPSALKPGEQNNKSRLLLGMINNLASSNHAVADFISGLNSVWEQYSPSSWLTEEWTFDSCNRISPDLALHFLKNNVFPTGSNNSLSNFGIVEPQSPLILHFCWLSNIFFQQEIPPNDPVVKVVAGIIAGNILITSCFDLLKEISGVQGSVRASFDASKIELFTAQWANYCTVLEDRNLNQMQLNKKIGQGPAQKLLKCFFKIIPRLRRQDNTHRTTKSKQSGNANEAYHDLIKPLLAIFLDYYKNSEHSQISQLFCIVAKITPWFSPSPQGSKPPSNIGIGTLLLARFGFLDPAAADKLFKNFLTSQVFDKKVDSRTKENELTQLETDRKTIIKFLSTLRLQLQSDSTVQIQNLIQGARNWAVFLGEDRDYNELKIAILGRAIKGLNRPIAAIYEQGNNQPPQAVVILNGGKGIQFLAPQLGSKKKQLQNPLQLLLKGELKIVTTQDGTEEDIREIIESFNLTTSNLSQHRVNCGFSNLIKGAFLNFFQLSQLLQDSSSSDQRQKLSTVKVDNGSFTIYKDQWFPDSGSVEIVFDTGQKFYRVIIEALVSEGIRCFGDLNKEDLQRIVSRTAGLGWAGMGQFINAVELLLNYTMPDSKD